MTKVRDIVWPYEYSDLKRIEEFMICGICYEYMETSVMTPCSHNYCSLCIRKYLHYKTQCPACFHVFFEKDLYINRTMDGMIQYYLQIREKLVNLIENKNLYNLAIQEQKVPNSSPVRPARSNQFSKSSKIPEIVEYESKSPIINSQFASSITAKCNILNISINKSPKVVPNIANIFNTPKRKKILLQPIVNTKIVSCPVCSVEISENHINAHLDACLKREVDEEIIKNKQIISKRPPMPKLVLRVMKDAELRKKMKEFGLSAHGDRKILENRFTRYSTIFNAECDKLVPRPVADLIKQCEMEEKQERKMDSFLMSTSTSNRLQIERNAKEEKIEEAQKNYRHANKSNFDKLIEEVKNRKEIREKHDIEITNFINAPSTSMVDESILESVLENEQNIFKLTNETAFQDFDSIESCPLQKHKSDDPLKYFSINLNDSSLSSNVIECPIKTPQKVIVTKNDNIKESIDQENNSSSSTDDDVSVSLILNKNLNRKKIKLSTKLENKSNPIALPVSILTNCESTDIKNERVLTKDLCNSIINDFSFDGLSDNSSSEFVDKPRKIEMKKLELKTDGNLSDSESLNRIKLQGKNDSLYKEFSEQNINYVSTNDFSNSVDDFSFHILSNNGYDELVNTCSKQIQKTNNEILEISLHLNNTQLEKANNASVVNENSVNKDIVCHPIRKSNRLLRLVEKQNIKQKDKKKIKLNDNSSGELYLSELNNSYKSIVSSDSSVKKRRCKPKLNFTDYLLDESQNPPKRPVRRQQAAANRNLC